MNNIILVFLLFMRLNELLSKPLKSNEQLKPSNILEDAENKYLWTIRQLERCYVLSKTLSYEDRLDYLITLQRKVYISN
jgi:hypothetical protein